VEKVRELEKDAEKRKQTEDTLRRKEQHFRDLIENSDDIIWTADLDLRTVYVSSSIQRKLGFTPEERLAQALDEQLTPSSYTRVTDALLQELKREEEHGADPDRVVRIEVEFYHKDGSILWFENIASWMRDGNGNPTGIQGISRDITERKQAEQALRDSEVRFRSLIEQTTDAVFCYEYDPPIPVDLPEEEQVRELYRGILAECNDVCARSYGAKKAEEVVGRGLTDLFGTIPGSLDQLFLAMIRGGYRTVDREGVEFLADGTKRYFLNNGHGIIEDGRLVRVWGTFRDITDRKRAEEALKESGERLARAEKMESLGLLAGGVAHDLNNVLSGIVSYPELILMDLPRESKLRRPIETIRESGDRAVAIVQDLLTVAGGVATSREPLNLNDQVIDYLDSPEFRKIEQFHPGVSVKTDLDRELLNISSSHVHIRKLVMNLVANASEAIEGSGNVVLSTTNRYVDRPLRRYDDVNIGEYVVLSVSDDGSGIPSDDLHRIFEPFYTKKVMGRSGTGLGLAVVWNVMKDHKGYIEVTSDEGGTTFELYFPITRDDISEENPSIPIRDLRGHGETILVVDDMANQREISCRLLDTLGYSTAAVPSGEEAVEYLKTHAVDLLLLDMIMDPGMNGRETYERINEIHPHQKAVIVSGFAETDEVKRAQELGAGRYVRKPLVLERIGLAVKEELRAATAPGSTPPRGT